MPEPHAHDGAGCRICFLLSLCNVIPTEERGEKSPVLDLCRNAFLRVKLLKLQQSELDKSSGCLDWILFRAKFTPLFSPSLLDELQRRAGSK